MSEVFEAKVRRVGNSLGIIIPKRVVDEGGFSEGDTVNVALPNSDAKARIKKLRALMGVARGAGPFVRDKRDRF